MIKEERLILSSSHLIALSLPLTSQPYICESLLLSTYQTLCSVSIARGMVMAEPTADANRPVAGAVRQAMTNQTVNNGNIATATILQHRSRVQNGSSKKSAADKGREKYPL